MDSRPGAGTSRARYQAGRALALRCLQTGPRLVTVCSGAAKRPLRAGRLGCRLQLQLGGDGFPGPGEVGGGHCPQAAEGVEVFGDHRHPAARRLAAPGQQKLGGELADVGVLAGGEATAPRDRREGNRDRPAPRTQPGGMAEGGNAFGRSAHGEQGPRPLLLDPALQQVFVAVLGDQLFQQGQCLLRLAGFLGLLRQPQQHRVPPAAVLRRQPAARLAEALERGRLAAGGFEQAAFGHQQLGEASPLVGHREKPEGPVDPGQAKLGAAQVAGQIGGEPQAVGQRPGFGRRRSQLEGQGAGGYGMVQAAGEPFAIAPQDQPEGQLGEDRRLGASRPEFEHQGFQLVLAVAPPQPGIVALQLVDPAEPAANRNSGLGGLHQRTAQCRHDLAGANDQRRRLVPLRRADLGGQASQDGGRAVRLREEPAEYQPSRQPARLGQPQDFVQHQRPFWRRRLAQLTKSLLRPRARLIRVSLESKESAAQASSVFHASILAFSGSIPFSSSAPAPLFWPKARLDKKCLAA